MTAARNVVETPDVEWILNNGVRSLTKVKKMMATFFLVPLLLLVAALAAGENHPTTDSYLAVTGAVVLIATFGLWLGLRIRIGREVENFGHPINKVETVDVGGQRHVTLLSTGALCYPFRSGQDAADEMARMIGAIRTDTVFAPLIHIERSGGGVRLRFSFRFAKHAELDGIIARYMNQGELEETLQYYAYIATDGDLVPTKRLLDCRASEQRAYCLKVLEALEGIVPDQREFPLLPFDVTIEGTSSIDSPIPGTPD